MDRRGRRVEVDLGAEIDEGLAEGVDPETGGLLVRGDDGTLRTHRYGEVVRCRVQPVEANL